MAQAEEHIRELLKLSAKERVRAAKLLLEGVDDPSVFSDVTGSDAELDALDHLRLITGAAARQADTDTDIESTDEFVELDEAAADEEALRAAIRAVVRAELEPLGVLTSLLRRFAEHARTTGHALRARTV